MEGICGQGVSSCAAYDTVDAYYEQVGLGVGACACVERRRVFIEGGGSFVITLQGVAPEGPVSCWPLPHNAASLGSWA